MDKLEFGLHIRELSAGQTKISPHLVGPEPVVIQGMCLGNAFEDSPVYLFHDSGVGRVCPQLFQAFLDLRGDSADPVPGHFLTPSIEAERHLGAQTCLYPDTSGMCKGLSEHPPGAFKDVMTTLLVSQFRHAPIHDQRAISILLKELCGTSVKSRRFHGIETPSTTWSQGVGVVGRVGERDLPVRCHVFGQTDPHGWFRPFLFALFGMPRARVRVEPHEVHAHLAELGNDHEVIVRIPPVRSGGEVVKWKDSASLEHRHRYLVDTGKPEVLSGIRNGIAMKIEANAEVFGKTIGSVQGFNGAAAGDNEDLPVVVGHRLEVVSAARRFDCVETAQCRQYRGTFLDNQNQVTPGRQRSHFRDGQEPARRQVRVPSHFLCGHTHLCGSV